LNGKADEVNVTLKRSEETEMVTHGVGGLITMAGVVALKEESLAA
jgi:hypothetical protein